MNMNHSENSTAALEGSGPLMKGKEVDAELKIGPTKRYQLVATGHLELVKIGRSSRFTTRSVKRIAEHGAP